MDDELQELLIAAERRFRSTWSAKLQRIFYRLIRSYFILTVKCLFWLRDLVILSLNATYFMLVAPLDAAVTTCYFGAVFSSKRTSGPQMKTPVNNRIVELSLIRKLLWNGSGVSIGRYLSSLTVPANELEKEESTKQWIRKTETQQPSYPNYPISRPHTIGDPINQFESTAAGPVALTPVKRTSQRSPPLRRHSLASFVPHIQDNLWSNSEAAFQPRDFSLQPAQPLQASIPHNIADTISRSIPADSYLNRVSSGSRHHHYGRRIYTKSSSLLKKSTNSKK